MAEPGSVLGLAALGGLVGALQPRVIALIPDRVPPTGEPPLTPYRALASAPLLAVRLAGLTAAIWAALVLALGVSTALPAYLVVAGLGVAMAYVDVRERRLPDWLTYSAFAGAAALLTVAAVAGGAWTAYSRAWLSAMVMAAAFFLLFVARPGELGFGDVKLAAVLGLLLGWIGWGHVVVGAFLGFGLAGLYAMVLLIARHAHRRSQIPFGPFLLAGALGALVWGATLL